MLKMEILNKNIRMSSPILLFLLLSANIFSQEYRYEIGGAAGSSFYLGDANETKLYLHPGFTGGALFRYNLSFHYAVKANLLFGRVSGNSKDSGNTFPFGQNAAFDRTFSDLSAVIEFNFLPYSDRYNYIGTEPFTPYVFIGTGITYGSGERRFLGLNLPFGIGVKYKLKNRVNIGFELSMRKLFRDDFDVSENALEWDLNRPYGIQSSLLKNRDCYSLTLIFLTWEFGLDEDPCR